ncbi:proton-conducting transporter transmembrane domain-containing protein [Pontibacter sp. MBLB2868]|uniref:proton-conducting transporter transmembrane domain-containing protein n=1 Tax=Pontibacter sp. MBLB2868 TaxID=3451555 RepID=UPI003F74E18F
MSDHLLLILPLLLPLLGAVMSVFLWQLIKWHILIVALAQAGWLFTAVVLLSRVMQHGILTTQIGNWPAPYGITLVVDFFSALIFLTASIIALAVYLFSLAGLDRTRKKFGYYPLMLLLQMGVGGVCLTGDIFNLYVWFELILICSFALISLGGKKAQLEGTLKYLTINFIASGLLLTGVGVIYSLFGSLNLAELSLIIHEGHPNIHLLSVAGVFFLTGFGIKSALFPLFFWLPASYHTPPIAVSAFMGGLISKIGIYTLVRIYTLLFMADHAFNQPFLLVISGLTMMVGVIGAAAQMDLRKILSFHVISQVGYMLMGLAIYTPLAIAGTIFFMIHNIVVKTNLFLISGVVAQRHRTFSLYKLGAIYLKQPMLSLMFFISAMALAGLPPLSGFWGKLMLAMAGFQHGHYIIIGVSLCVSLVTLFSMTKIWNEVFWKPKPVIKKSPVELSAEDLLRNKLLYLPVAFLLLFIILFSFFPQPLIHMSERSADQLLHSEIYRNAVLKKDTAY